MTKNSKFTTLLTFVLSFALLYGTYLVLSTGLPDKAVYLQLRRYLPCAAAVTLSIYLWRQAQMPLRKLLPQALLALAWIWVYPLCYWLTYHQNTTFIDNHFDIAFGAYAFAALTCLQLLFLAYSHSDGQHKSACFSLSVVQTLLALLPLTQLGYYCIYQSPITEAACMALLQTNPAEAREYLLQNLGYSGLAGAGLALLLLLGCFYLGCRKTPAPGPITRKITLCSLLVLILTGVYAGKILPETGVLWAYQNAQEYFLNSQKFHTFHQSKVAELEVTPARPPFAKPGTIIMVIGESASRDFLSAYGYQGNDTTPWLRSLKEQPTCFLFQHAYTSWGQTVPALERALTEKNQYNTLEFNQSVTILDIAKKAGYTTSWFSNQGTISNADTPITMVAKTADKSAWLEEELATSTTAKYDGDLLAYLSRLDPTQNNFVVLHIMGSHDSAINRYPASFTKFGQPGVYDLALNYDNSIAYTDQVLQQLYTYGKEHLNLQAFVYFSDHGADPLIKRHPDRSNFISLRIPFFIAVSPEYANLYPETVRTLRQHENTYFTNDLMYETMCGLLGITSNHYVASNSLTSPSYKYTAATLTTQLGQMKLSDDK